MDEDLVLSGFGQSAGCAARHSGDQLGGIDFGFAHLKGGDLAGAFEAGAAEDVVKLVEEYVLPGVVDHVLGAGRHVSRRAGD